MQLTTYIEPSTVIIERIIQRPQLDTSALGTTIEHIFSEVGTDGDEALFRMTEQYDKVKLTSLLVDKEEMQRASTLLPEDLREAILIAYDNIKTFHQSQILRQQVITTTPGVKCWQEARAIQRVGLYIPGGTAPLFSTVLMLGVPAQVAGCQEIVLCTPPSEDGSVHPAILYAAGLCGISRIVKVGGAQAIAAMVLGTESVPRVYKVLGPGNQYVTAAKMYGLHHGIAIDLPAGPSEVLVYADHTANPHFVAADLLSQAEHGIDSQVVLVATEQSIVEAVNAAIDQQLETLPRAMIAQRALDNAYACIISSREAAYDFINRYAPEHLIICADDAQEHLALIHNAGSVFIGHWTPESAGDYASGTNHTLPTAAHARAYSGVSLDTFVKKVTFQHITQQGLDHLGPVIMTMAQHEQLEGHANAVRLRIQKS